MGVFPKAASKGTYTSSLPHARGGVSIVNVVILTADAVFPTLVGVFLDDLSFAVDDLSLPHARGGVSSSLSISG